MANHIPNPNTPIDALMQKLWAAQLEMRHSGPVHRRDLSRYIQKLRKQILKAQQNADSA